MICKECKLETNKITKELCHKCYQKQYHKTYIKKQIKLKEDICICCNKFKLISCKKMCNACYKKEYKKTWKGLKASREREKTWAKEYRQRPEVKQKAKEYRKIDYVKENIKKYNHSKKRHEYMKNYMKNYRKTDKHKAYQKKYDQTEKRKSYIKKYSSSDKKKKYQLSYYEKNRIAVRKTQNKWRQKKLKEDQLYKLKTLIRKMIFHSFKKKKITKNTKTYFILGCSFEELKIYFEKLFYNNLKNNEEMTWDNYGWGDDKWNIDHIMPISKAKTKEDVIKLNHYTNLQPMWHWQNMEKSDKLDYIVKKGENKNV